MIRGVRHSPPPNAVPLPAVADAVARPNEIEQPPNDANDAPPLLVAQAEVPLRRAPPIEEVPDDNADAESVPAHDTISWYEANEAVAEEEADIQRRLRALRLQKQELQNLRLDVANYIRENAAVIATAAVPPGVPRHEDAVTPAADRRPIDDHNRPPAPHSLVKSITQFSGDDATEDIAEFFRDLEMVLGLYETDAAYKTLAVRYAVTGTAKLFVSTLDDRSYDAVKAELMREFGRAMTPADAERLL